jgi:hypothetical protein
MKKIKFFIGMILATCCLMINSCNIDDLPLSAIPEFQPQSIEALLFNNISLGFYKMEIMEYLNNDSNLSYVIFASFYNNSFEDINVGTVEIDTFKIIQKDSNSSYVQGFNLKLNDSLPVFGKNCFWGWTGNNTTGISAWKTGFYSYKIINILNFKNYDTIDISKGFEIKWNPDLFNNNKIPILLNFGGYSWHTFVKDNGYFNIPDIVKKYIYVRDTISISIGRISNKLFEIGDMSCSLTASTICEKKIFIK